MGRNTFAFSNVLNVEKVDDFFEKFKERVHPFDNVQYWSCYVEGVYPPMYEDMNDDPGKRNVKGMVQFGLKQELPDVKQWFLSVFGNMLCVHLFVLPVLDVHKVYSFVKEQGKESRHGRAWSYGKFKEYDEVEEENDLFAAVFYYFVNGGERGALTDHFPLTKILNMPITKIEEEAQYRKKWLNDNSALNEPSPKRVCSVETHTESIVTEQEAPPLMPHTNYFVGRWSPSRQLIGLSESK